ncbi:MAG: hypothetical protein JXJ20_13875 [Anaerolineae bacterium]|jgi:hypothetical protein|nr:hypothetical protein [Anaerolineae bacterium]
MPTRKEILEMLSSGQIDVTRATEMLNEVQSASEAAAVPPTPAAPEEPAVPAASKPPAVPAPPDSHKRRWLHIHVCDLESGESRVRVNVPLKLVNFGLKVGARFTDEMDSDMIQDVMAALNDEDVVGTLVEVEDMEDNERVHIYVD